MCEIGLAPVNILGVGVHPVDLDRALALIASWIDAHQKRYVCLTAIHSILDCRQDRGLRAIFNRSGLTTADGMPLVWLCRLMGHRQVGRVYGPDLMLAACALSQARGYRVFFYGGEPGVAQSLGRRLRDRFPDLQIAGAIEPPMLNEPRTDDSETLKAINDAGPDIVWVGLGTGKQERWMAAQRGQLEAPVLIAVGAAFDFLAGTKPQAPRWMRRTGLEWLFRLAMEPSRLWPRYREYPRFGWLLVQQFLGLRQFPLDG